MLPSKMLSERHETHANFLLQTNNKDMLCFLIMILYLLLSIHPFGACLEIAQGTVSESGGNGEN